MDARLLRQTLTRVFTVTVFYGDQCCPGAVNLKMIWKCILKMLYNTLDDFISGSFNFATTHRYILKQKYMVKVSIEFKGLLKLKHDRDC